MSSEMSLLTEYWEQVVGLLALVVVAVRLSSSVKELKKDVNDIVSRGTFTETTKLRAQTDMQEKQISALWAYTNKLRDMINGRAK